MEPNKRSDPLLLFWSLLVLFFIGGASLTGCLESGDSPELESSGEPDARDPLNGSEVRELTEVTPIVDLGDASATAWEADVLCVAGGGPMLPRVDGNHVLPGTETLNVRLEVPISHTAVQVGYVLDSNEAGHAPSNNRSITWLPQVNPGEARNFTVDVEPQQQERGKETRWAFYQRHQPPGIAEVCYTGGGVGPKTIRVDAVPS